MRTLMVLVMKFVCALIAFTVGLNLFFNATITEIISFSLLTTLVSYFLGDLLILPNLGNATATVVDFILTYVVIWVFGSVVLHNYLQIAWGSILSAAIITLGEIFIHYYLINQTDLNKSAEKRTFNPSLDRATYMTEFAEENEYNDPTYKKD
ncbi:MAG TPA: YndM family protein [Candidatus Angelobacter sp.]|nr:YndM family protein [Candidatus Angelobacter sp.]